MLATNGYPQPLLIWRIAIYIKVSRTFNDICNAGLFVSKLRHQPDDSIHFKVSFRVGKPARLLVHSLMGLLAHPSTLWQVTFRLLPLQTLSLITQSRQRILKTLLSTPSFVEDFGFPYEPYLHGQQEPFRRHPNWYLGVLSHITLIIHIITHI